MGLIKIHRIHGKSIISNTKDETNFHLFSIYSIVIMKICVA